MGGYGAAPGINKMDILKRIKRKVKRVLLGAQTNNIHGGFECSVCGMANVGMDPLPIFYFTESHKYRFAYNIFYNETINYAHYSCKKCGALDRDRLYALYLRGYLKDKKKINLLDIAPAPALTAFLRQYPNVIYRSMDLMMANVDDKLDITNMHLYKDGQFDFFICSHVLEHIPDDIKAMQELYRVLKPGGKGITMVPINLQVEKTVEDPNCTDVATRWRLFGQDDHVRMYAKKDFIDRLESVGFKMDLYDINYFGAETFEKNAIFPTSVLYIVSK